MSYVWCGSLYGGERIDASGKDFYFGACFPIPCRYIAHMKNIDTTKPLLLSQNVPTMVHLDNRRKFVGIKVKDLCARVGCSTSAYRHWKRNGTSLFMVNKINEAILAFAKENKL